MVAAFIIFFIILSSGSLIGAAIFNRKFEEIVPITAGSIVLFFFSSVF